MSPGIGLTVFSPERGGGTMRDLARPPLLAFVAGFNVGDDGAMVGCAFLRDTGSKLCCDCVGSASLGPGSTSSQSMSPRFCRRRCLLDGSTCFRDVDGYIGISLWKPESPRYGNSGRPGLEGGSTGVNSGGDEGMSGLGESYRLDASSSPIE
jgi:hypothetical protein